MDLKLQEALLNAVILGGLGFFTFLAGAGAVGLLADPKLALCGAAIAGGLQFFIRLAAERGLK